ncbi:tetratricopeptide repeat protein 37-like isoform X2 [Arctopsyche grandis]|uniref:tetratricopeptide repeat protein 37-like isoform X2 n=1 Tax=Arctopsyche grandis TaxID=121162 RepID=UPI00406D8D9F
MSNSKNLRKSAKNAIRRGDFSTAVEKCEAALKSQQDNYNALVLLGVALREDKKAESIFKRAIELEGDNVVAYQKLVKYYESKDTSDCSKSLMKLYYRMSKLSGENEADALDKMYTIALKLDDYNVCGSIINDLICQERDSKRRDRLVLLLAKILTYTSGRDEIHMAPNPGCTEDGPISLTEPCANVLPFF